MAKDGRPNVAGAKQFTSTAGDSAQELDWEAYGDPDVDEWEHIGEQLLTETAPAAATDPSGHDTTPLCGYCHEHPVAQDGLCQPCVTFFTSSTPSQLPA